MDVIWRKHGDENYGSRFGELMQINSLPGYLEMGNWVDLSVIAGISGYESSQTAENVTPVLKRAGAGAGAFKGWL